MKRFLLYLVFLGGNLLLLQAQQQPLLSLQPAYPSWYNPGATAYSTGQTISFGYRSQWNPIQDAPNAQLLAFDSRNKEKDIFGWGVTMLREKAHRDNLFSFQARSAFHIEAVNGHHFSLGIGLGAINRYRDYRGLIIEDYRDANLLQGNTYNVWKLDASLGFQYHYQTADGKYDFKVSMAANRLPMMFEEAGATFRYDQVAHLTTNLQLGFWVSEGLVLEPGLQQLSLLSDFSLKAGGTSLWLRATYQKKFWAALFMRPGASTFGMMLGAVVDEGKYAGTLAIDSHSQLGSTWELGGYANFSPSARCLGEIEERMPFWNSERELAAQLQPVLEANGLDRERVNLSHSYANAGVEISFSLAEEDRKEMNWKTLPESENIVRVICADVIRDAMEICKDPHLEEIVRIKLTYYTKLPPEELEKLSEQAYDASMGDGVILLGKVDGKTKRRAIFEGDMLSNMEFELAKLYSLKERILYRLGDLGLDKNKLEIQIISGEAQAFPYQISFEMR